MSLVMQNGEPAVEAVMKMGRKLQELEDSVMKASFRIVSNYNKCLGRPQNFRTLPMEESCRPDRTGSR